MNLEKRLDVEAIDTQIRFRSGQYINKVFLLDEGFELKCSMHRGYEYWFGVKQNIIIENTKDDHCIVYKVFNK